MLFDFATVEDCAATVSGIIASGVVPAAVEMMDRGHRGRGRGVRARGVPDRRRGDPDRRGRRRRRPPSRRRPKRSRRPLARNRTRSVRIAADEAERALIWKGRKNAFGAVATIAPHYHLHDCVVPRTKLVDVLTGVYEIAARHELIVTNVFHAGDGNLHPLLSFDRGEPGTLERVLPRERGDRPPVRRGGRGAARASTGSGSRSATSCRSCSPPRTFRRRRACGRRSTPRGG